MVSHNNANNLPIPSSILFQVSQGENELARQLYERLLEKTSHVKVWISYAKFEGACEENDDGVNIAVARRIYERANDGLRSAGDKEPRVILLEAWRDFELEFGTPDTRDKVAERMPRRIKKRQRIISESGFEEGWEEIFDYIFPEDEAARPNLRLLAAAKNWKKQKETVPIALPASEESDIPDAPAAPEAPEAPTASAASD